MVGDVHALMHLSSMCPLCADTNTQRSCDMHAVSSVYMAHHCLEAAVPYSPNFVCMHVHVGSSFIRCIVYTSLKYVSQETLLVYI